MVLVALDKQQQKFDGDQHNSGHERSRHKMLETVVASQTSEATPAGELQSASWAAD